MFATNHRQRFGNGIRDKGRQHMRLEDFQNQHARDAKRN